MPFPTEPIGSIPRSAELIAAWGDRRAGHISTDRFQEIAERDFGILNWPSSAFCFGPPRNERVL
jgi:hypothetical protein